MPGRILLDFYNPALDSNGVVIVGATKAFYLNGTTTLQNVYSDATLHTPLANPYTGNSAGRFPEFWAADDQTYTVVLRDGNDVLIQTLDDVRPALSLELYDPSAGGTGDVITVTVDDFNAVDGTAIAFIASADNTGPATITITHGDGVVDAPRAIVKDTSGGPAALDGGEIITSNRIELGYEAAGDRFHLLSYPSAQALNTITPPALVAQADNYHPTDLTTAGTIRLSATGSQTITGIDAISDGYELTLENIGNDTIVLAVENANSDAANRFLFPDPVQIGPEGSAKIKYDGTSARWRLVAQAINSGSYHAAIFAANDTWTVPDTVAQTTNVRIRAVASGGGSGGISTNDGAAATGGASGGYCEWVGYGFTAAQVATIVIGAAPAGGSAGGNGVSGNTTTFTYATVAIITNTGGTGGNGATAATGRTAGVSRGTSTILLVGSGLTQVFALIGGAQHSTPSINGSFCGQSGGNPLGAGVSGSAGALTALGYGSGGGPPGPRAGGVDAAGTAGAPGVLILEWYA